MVKKDNIFGLKTSGNKSMFNMNGNSPRRKTRVNDDLSTITKGAITAAVALPLIGAGLSVLNQGTS